MSCKDCGESNFVWYDSEGDRHCDNCFEIEMTPDTEEEYQSQLKYQKERSAYLDTIKTGGGTVHEESY